MRAHVGDHILVRGQRVQDPDRRCTVVEVRGADGGPPYLVAWGVDGHRSLFFPGPDALVDPSGGSE